MRISFPQNRHHYFSFLRLNQQKIQQLMIDDVDMSHDHIFMIISQLLKWFWYVPRALHNLVERLGCSLNWQFFSKLQVLYVLRICIGIENLPLIRYVPKNNTMTLILP